MKICPFCQTEIKQHEGEWLSDFNRRLTCGSSICLKKQRIQNFKGNKKIFDNRYRAGMTEKEWAIQQYLTGQLK